MGFLLGAMPAAAAAEPTMAELVEELVECRDIRGENYCLHIGFTAMRPGDARWEEMLAHGAEESTGKPGGMSLYESLRQVAQTPIQERKQQEAAEWRSARQAVGTVKLADHVGYQREIPAGFFSIYPELGITEGSEKAQELRDAARNGDSIDVSRWHTPTAAERAEERRATEAAGGEVTTMGIPSYRYIITNSYQEQVRSYYCGPATFQSIDHGDDGNWQSQDHWANYLNTTSDGTSIQSMVNAIDNYTNWGNYSVVDTHDRGASWYFAIHKSHIGIAEKPLVEHVKLWDQYYSYLARDHNGHFQTGRGYSNNSATIAIFEPYDERDFGSGNHTGMKQYVNYTKVYQANQAYPSWNTNIGA